MPDDYTYDRFLFYIECALDSDISYDDRDLYKCDNVWDITAQRYIYEGLYKLALDNPGADPDDICQMYLQKQQQFYEMAGENSSHRYIFQQAIYEIQIIYDHIWTICDEESRE